MKLSFSGLKHTNWFYIASVIFAIALPFSIALISISSGFLIVAALLNVNTQNIKSNYQERKLLFFVIGIYFIYIGWLFFTEDWKWATYDLQKNIAYLIVPIAFIFSPKLSKLQYKRILYIFSFSVVSSAIITLVHYYLNDDHSILDAQLYGFMHHIRFSLEIVFSILILIQLLHGQGKKQNTYLKPGIIGAILVLGIFLVWHQSLTGIITFIGTGFIALVLWISQLPRKRTKIAAGFILCAISLLPVAYLYYAIDRYYTIDSIEFNDLDMFTSEGNNYQHDLTNQIIENGHYVGLYVCEKELAEEWNKRSILKYNEIDKFGYGVKSTLVRYLTSKNLRKDADGVKALTDMDVKNIESGISNYILADKSLSLYPRIYVSIWELDTYFKTGNANHRSLAQRIEYSKAATSIIKENLWLGVGTGNWKKAYRNFYVNNKTKISEARYGNVHNQYLNYMVKFGVIGLLLILFAIIYPVIKTKAYRNQLFVLFLVIMFIGNFGDANMETHTGSNFFMFFYCLFMVPKSG